MTRVSPRHSWFHSTLQFVVVVGLLCLAGTNIAHRVTWSDVEDGVLWRASGSDVVAAAVAADTPAARGGIQPGDILYEIDGKSIDSPNDVAALMRGASKGQQLHYKVLRARARQIIDVAVAPIPSSPLPLYLMLASVGIFTLLVGTSVRLRRPEHQATLHFFWLTVAFFGAAAFSYTGKLDTLDWTFYWADLTAQLLLPPLLLHFALVFPDRPDAWVRSDMGRTLVPAFYLPALLLGAASVAGVINGDAHGEVLSRIAALVERAQFVYLAVTLIAGLAIMVRALRRVRSVTARRQLRWIVWGTAFGAIPFVLGYAVPYALGLPALRHFEYSVLLLGLIPLAFASAIVRYRLMDVEVIIKRGLVYAAALAAIAAIYAILLTVAGGIFLRDADQRTNPIIALLATLVVVLLSRPVKNAIQTGLDRVYYRDRYDYRRALVGFARDLNSDLDLQRLSERLVHRITETLLVDRMALMLAPVSLSPEDGEFITIAHAGFGQEPPRLARASEVGTRLIAGHTLALDDNLALRRISALEVEFWRDAGIHYFVPCVSKEGTIAVMALGRKASSEPLSSEDMALLSAVAPQAATALENGRLYRQLRTKADELERMRQFSENILESLNDGMAVLAVDGRVVRWNRQLEEIYGIRHEQAVGRQLTELFDGAIANLLRSSSAAPEGVAHYRVPLMTRHDPQRRLLVNIAATALLDSSGDVAGTILIMEDISSRVQLEEQLQISEKMASIGLLAAGVAHEVNTPLTGISSFTQMLLERADPEDPRTKVLEKIERQTFRAAKIVNGLLNLARPASVDRGPCDINAVINDVLSLLEHQFKTGRIQVRKELASPAPLVQGIEYKLQQVLLNLFMNARDAMPKGGWLTIVSRMEEDAAVVEIGDTGSGIPAEHLSRIYDPFFTTKAIGKGTGLGLSITYGIVQEHGGAITCESHVGQGTRFILRLPLAAQAVKARLM